MGLGELLGSTGIVGLDPEAPATEAHAAAIERRPGLSGRLRRLVTLTCTAATGDEAGFEQQALAALRARELSIDDLEEFTLHFAMYCGFPKGSLVNAMVQRQVAVHCAEEGLGPRDVEEAPLWRPELAVAERVQAGEACFVRINCGLRAPKSTPFVHTGILSIVFGEIWLRPQLDIRDRRVICISAVALDGTMVPVRTHVYMALKSGDLSPDELDELVLQFWLQAGWSKASFLHRVASEAWAQIESEGGLWVPQEG
jgi:4-carboxymuconolactone decarboxylase